MYTKDKKISVTQGRHKEDPKINKSGMTNKPELNYQAKSKQETNLSQSRLAADVIELVLDSLCKRNGDVTKAISQINNESIQSKFNYLQTQFYHSKRREIQLEKALQEITCVIQMGLDNKFINEFKGQSDLLDFSRLNKLIKITNQQKLTNLMLRDELKKPFQQYGSYVDPDFLFHINRFSKQVNNRVPTTSSSPKLESDLLHQCSRLLKGQFNEDKSRLQHYNPRINEYFRQIKRRLNINSNRDQFKFQEMAKKNQQLISYIESLKKSNSELANRTVVTNIQRDLYGSREQKNREPSSQKPNFKSQITQKNQSQVDFYTKKRGELQSQCQQKQIQTNKYIAKYNSLIQKYNLIGRDIILKEQKLKTLQREIQEFNTTKTDINKLLTENKNLKLSNEQFQKQVKEEMTGQLRANANKFQDEIKQFQKAANSLLMQSKELKKQNTKLRETETNLQAKIVELNQIQKRYEQLDSYVNKLLSKKHIQEEEMKGIKLKLDKMQNELKSNSEYSEQQKDKFKQQIQKITQQYRNEKIFSMRNYQKKQLKIATELSIKEAQITKLKQQLEAKRKQVENLNHQKQNHQHGIQGFQIEVNKLRDNLTSLQKSQSSAQQKNGALSKEIQKLKYSLAKKVESENLLQKKIAQMNSVFNDIDILRQKLKKMTLSHDQKWNEVNQLQIENNYLKAQINETQKQLKDHSIQKNVSESSKMQLRQSTEQIDKLTIKVKELTDRVKEEIALRKEKEELLTQTIKERDFNKQNAEQSKAKLHEVERNLDEVKDQIQNQYKRHQQQVAKLETQIVLKQSNLDKLAAQLKSFEDQRKSQLHQKLRDYYDIKVQLNQKSNQLTSSQIQIQKNKEQLKVQQAKIQKLTEQLLKVTSKFSPLQEKVKSQEAQIHQKNIQISQKDKQRQSLSEKHKNLNASKEEILKKYEEQKKQWQRVSQLKQEQQKKSIGQKNIIRTNLTQQLNLHKIKNDELTHKIEKLMNNNRQLIKAKKQLEDNFDKINHQLLITKSDLQIALASHKKLIQQGKNDQPIPIERPEQLNIIKGRYQQSIAKIDKLEKQIQDTRKICSEKTIQLEEQEQRNEKLTEQVVQITNKCKSIQSERQSLEVQCEILKKEKGKESQERQKQQKKIKKLNEDIDDLSNQVDMLHSTLEEVTKMNQENESPVQSKNISQPTSQETIQKEIALKITQIKQKDEQIDQLKKQLEMLTSINSLAEKEKDELQQKITALEEQMKQLKTKIGDYQIQYKALNKTILMLQKEKSEVSKRHENQKVEIEQKQRLIQSQLLAYMNSSNSQIETIFQNQILQYFPQYKKYLRSVIQSHMQCKIIKSRLIYKFDRENKINFHKYFDKKQNLVIIVKIFNGNYIAGYTQDSFEPLKSSSGEGLIISLTNRQVFTTIQRKRRAITYDDYYLIFGNSEIRIKSMEDKIFSNFAISNGYYSSRGKKVSVLLGGDPSQRELEFQSYEIYQLEMIPDY